MVINILAAIRISFFHSSRKRRSSILNTVGRFTRRAQGSFPERSYRRIRNYQTIQPVCLHHRLDIVRNHLTCRQNILHALMAHRNAPSQSRSLPISTGVPRQRKFHPSLSVSAVLTPHVPGRTSLKAFYDPGSDQVFQFVIRKAG